MLIEQSSHLKVIGEAEDGETAVAKVLESKPDVVMMDLGLPKVDGIEATSQIKAQLPNTKVLIFTTAEDDSSIFSALKAGADGYCLKTISGELLAMAIQSVLNGAAWLDPGIANKVLRAQSQGNPKATAASNLSESKIQLLSLLESGKNLSEIASELNVADVQIKGLLDDLLTQLKGASGGASESTKSIIPESGDIVLKAGDIVGQHYKIETCIGRGGMGAVYRATHTFIQRTVAIKTLHRELAANPNTIQRFKIEAQASATVVHPNLVTIYDFGLIESTIPYIVMEFLQGQSFSDFLDANIKVTPAIGKKIFTQVCDGLAAVHSKGIVHRDLKPANVMLMPGEKDGFQIKLVDFGIAKIVEGDSHKVTQTGECLGSPLYMSPEQCYGSSSPTPIDHRSDLYALGCMMLEAFSGSPIFTGGAVIEILLKHVEQKPSTAPLEQAAVPKPLIDLIVRLTQKKAADRPSSAAEVKQILLSI